MRWFRPLGCGLVALGLLAGTMTTANAHPEPTADGAISDDGDRDAHQHGESSGHLPAGSSHVQLVSSLRLRNAEPEKIADVSVFNGYAYLAAWGVVTCKYNGVHVVDIRNPSSPQEVAFIPSKEGSYPGEGVHALHISTPAFTGDVLVTNNEKCNSTTGFGGMNLYNITNPEAPTPLAVGAGDHTVNGQGKQAANEIHSVFAWDAGDRAYAVMVDNEEAADVDIMDITDPRKPALVAEFDLAERFPQILQAAPANLTEVFHHDVIVKELNGRFIMSVSYWDGGYVLLDVTDPIKPTYVADSDFPNPDSIFTEVPPEGNAHQSEFTRDNRYLIGADEDFNPYALKATNTTDGTTVHASQGNQTKPLEPGQTITGTAVYFGRGCNGDPAAGGGGSGTQVAVVERGLCTFTEKVANVIDAGGYEAVLVFNRTGDDGGCEATLSMHVQGDIPTFGVAPRSEGFAILNTPYNADTCTGNPLPAPGTAGDTLTFSSYFDGWGYVRLFRNGTDKLQQLDAYAVAPSKDPAYATGFGDLSVHEVAVSQQRDDLLYLSYYSAGLRVLKITKAGRLQEAGWFIQEGGSNLWGVEVFEHGGIEYVATSDRDSGLNIFRYTGR